MQVINKKIIIIFICLIIFIFGLYKLFNKEKVVLDDVKLDIRDTNNTFAIYLENEYNSNNYFESKENEFPSIGYSFNKEKSQCVSINGDVIDNILSYDYETNKIVVDTTDSINCYLYFDRLTLGEAIKILKPNGLNLETTINSDEWTGMYRFQGQQSEEIENYICFGTSDQEECKAYPNKYMYRIIGIEENGRIKVIKKETLEETDQWWSDYSTNKYWNESLVFDHINGETFLKNTELVPSSWEDKIDINYWLFGSTHSNNQTQGARQSGVEVYKLETGQKAASWDEKANQGENYKGVQAIPYKVEAGDKIGTEYYYIRHGETWIETTNPHEVTAKIGLMNLSDYYLSVSNEANCQYNNNTYSGICNIGWMHLSQNDTNAPNGHEWTMTRYGWSIGWGRYYAYYVNNTGYANSTGYTDPWGLSSHLFVRPVFFLKNNILLIDGNGQIDSPFIIK